MGRNNEGRQTVKLPFNGKPVEFYKPNDAQATIVVMTASAGKSNGGKSVTRFFQVIEALVVNPDDWETMENAMISGSVELSDFFKLVESLFSYEWPDQEDAE